MQCAVAAPVKVHVRTRTQLRKKCTNNSAMPPQKQKQRHRLAESRLNTANSVLPFLHHCRWRKAVRRRRMTHQTAETGILKTTPTGGIMRTIPHLARQKHDISKKWRVSPMYVRRLVCINELKKCNAKKVHNAYLYSYERRRRMKYCANISKALIGDGLREREGALHRRPTCSVSRLFQPRTLCSPAPRGERDGLPAGPGLPHGDSTGDDG